MLVGEYLFRRVRDAGVEHIFGIPGDFVVPHFAAAEAAGFTIVPTAHEPGAGFAADAYARLRGLGMVLTTFGAGALNMVNAIAQAYAEKSPVLVVSGAPEVQGRRIDALFHHRVKSYESQLNVYCEVTGAAVAVNDPAVATEAVDSVLDTILTTKRPGYIEIPRDILRANARPAPGGRPPRPAADPAAVQEAMAEAIDRIQRSTRPVIYAGVETERFHLRASLIELVERLGVPVVTSIEGKCVFPEDHPNFVGIYMGQAGSRAAQEHVEGSDCLLMLGAFLTDVNTGQYSANIDRSRVIWASAEHLAIGHHIYPDITLTDVLARLLAVPDLGSHGFSPAATTPLAPLAPDDPLRTAHIIQELNRICASERYVVTCDVGDCLYASVDLRTDQFLGPGYYNSMGFGVPASLAVPLARPDRRAIVLVGDGGFQMTGLELSTARRLGQNPIVIVFDNGAYAMMQSIAGRKPYFDLPAWDYPALARSLGGRGARVTTGAELRAALLEAEQSTDFFLIDAVLDPTDVSPTWRRITEGIRARMGAS